MGKDNDENIEVLLRKIEKKIAWGNSSQWSSYDFDKLVSLIFDSTKIAISSNTLKRVWGRVKYDSKPSDVTLNTLAQFVGHKDYREFISESRNEKNGATAKVKEKPLLKWPPFGAKPSVIFASGAVFMLIAIIAMSYKFSGEEVDPNNFYLTSRKVTEGLPNSVIFEYRADKAPVGAKVEIQQSWDASKRQEVSISDSLATSIYYHPGFFKSKLVVGGQIVKEHDILIPSDGWSASTEKDGSPLLFEKSDILGDSAISVSKELLSKNGIDANLSGVKVDYRLVQDFDGLRLDDLNLSVTIKNDVNGGQNVCQNTSITLLLEGEAISIPLSKLGCMSELELWFFGRTISGKNRDMSKFGVDFNDWVTVNFTSKNNNMSILVNGEEAINLPFASKINKFYGFVFSFEGTGSIRDLKLSNSKKVYLDEDYSESVKTSQHID